MVSKNAWSSLNSVLGTTTGVCLNDVASAVGVKVEHLWQGKKPQWLDTDDEGKCQHLRAVSSATHGNSWPHEWENFIVEM